MYSSNWRAYPSGYKQSPPRISSSVGFWFLCITTFFALPIQLKVRIAKNIAQNGGMSMTDLEKRQIDIMRLNGYGYLKIAMAAGISKNTVKSYCRRQKSIESKLETDYCAICGRPIDKSKRENRRFCSDACRTKWWNEHPKAKMSYRTNCACCFS